MLFLIRNKSNLKTNQDSRLNSLALLFLQFLFYDKSKWEIWWKVEKVFPSREKEKMIIPSFRFPFSFYIEMR